MYPYGTIGFNNGKVIDFNRNLKYDSLKIRKSNQYLAFNYSGISIMKTELLRKYSFKYKNSKNFELSFYPFLIKNFKTNLIKLKGIWYSIDNIKDYNISIQKKFSAADINQIRELEFLFDRLV